MLSLVGVKNMLRTAYDAGVKSLEPTSENLSRFGLSITLGGGEVRLLDLVSGYATLANRGKYIESVAILEVKDRSGKSLDEAKDVKEKRVIGEDVAFLISHILSDNNARSEVFGPGSFLSIGGKTVAVKTGTTDDKRDNWAVGYTPSRAVGVWVGNNDNSPMNQKIASGVTGATPIWNRLMKLAIADLKNEDFAKPDNINALEIDAFGGGAPCRNYPKRSEYFIKGTEPAQDCLVEKTLNGIEYFVFVEYDPVSTDGKNRWQEGINVWTAAQNDSKYHAPSELLLEPTKNPDDISVSLIKPGGHSQVDYKLEVEANISTGRKIKKIEFYVDGSIKDTKNEDKRNPKFSYTFSNANKGKHKINVKAYNDADKSAEAEVEISVGQEWQD